MTLFLKSDSFMDGLLTSNCKFIRYQGKNHFSNIFIEKVLSKVCECPHQKNIHWIWSLCKILCILDVISNNFLLYSYCCIFVYSLPFSHLYFCITSQHFHELNFHYYFLLAESHGKSMNWKTIWQLCLKHALWLYRSIGHIQYLALSHAGVGMQTLVTRRAAARWLVAYAFRASAVPVSEQKVVRFISTRREVMRNWWNWWRWWRTMYMQTIVENDDDLWA